MNENNEFEADVEEFEVDVEEIDPDNPTEKSAKSDEPEVDTQRFAGVSESVRKAPLSDRAWDEAEELVERTGTPQPIANLYREILDGNLPKNDWESLARRAVRFFEEWFGEEPSEVISLLGYILSRDPKARWAFERITVVLTVAEQWDPLLSFYERELAGTENEERRRKLLDDAAHIAKDFANRPEKAIGYMRQMLDLNPNDHQLASSIERIAERLGQWSEVIDLWRSRLPVLPAEDAYATRVQIANCYLDRFSDPRSALEELRELLTKAPGHEEGCLVLERIFGDDNIEPEVRADALRMLRINYEATGRNSLIINALEQGLAFAQGADAVELHREAASRLAIEAEDAKAIRHYAQLLSLSPSDTNARKELRQLARRSGLYAAHAEALVAAAEKTVVIRVRVSLLVEAANISHDKLEDAQGAIELYTRVLEHQEADESDLLEVAHRLDKLLVEPEQRPERLKVLLRLADLNPPPAMRRHVLGQAGRLAEDLEDDVLALEIWKKRLTDDEKDIEALNAVVHLLEVLERWQELADVLRVRADVGVDHGRRNDLIRRASVLEERLEKTDDAIDAWVEIQKEFGRNQLTMESLNRLMSRAGRYEELAMQFEAAMSSDFSRTVDWFCRLGDILRMELDSYAAAIENYAQALELDPSKAEARSGLELMSEMDEIGPAAAEVLAKSYRKTGDWQAIVGLIETRLAGVEDARRKIEILREAAYLQEEREEDPKAALSTMVRCVVLDPTDLGIEKELYRLGRVTGDWDKVAVAYSDAAQRCDDPERAAHLYWICGRIVEENVEDFDSATEAFEKAHALMPERMEILQAVLRNAVRGGKWDSAARAVTELTQVKGVFEQEFVSLFESAAREAKAFPEMVGALEEVISDQDSVIAPALRRDWFLEISRWYREEVDDVEKGLVCARKGLKSDEKHAPALRTLAALLRKQPDEELVRVLLSLDDLELEDLDPLREAAQTAIEVMANSPDEVENILQKLYRKAIVLWLSGRKAPEGKPFEETVSWAQNQLVILYKERNKPGAAVAILKDSIKLPFEDETIQSFRRRAATILIEEKQYQEAVDILRDLLSQTPDDIELVRELASLYQIQSRLPDLLAMRRRELELCEEQDRKLDLRLEIATLVGNLEGQGGREAVLRDNLRELPGHEPSVKALEEILEARGHYEELAELLSTYAELLEERGDAEESARQWSKAAAVVEQRLGDSQRAIAMHENVVRLIDSNDSLDALARLSIEKSDFVRAVEWISKRLEIAGSSEKVSVRLRLARAQIRASHYDNAVETLEIAFTESPRNAEVIKLLFDLYRKREQWQELVSGLTHATKAAGEDKDSVRVFAAEAAETALEKLGRPEAAIEVLEKAFPLLPEQRTLGRILALGYHKAQRYEDARRVLDQLIEGFGRRRSSERAELHLMLARVLGDMELVDEAIDQFEIASKMDPSNYEILQSLAEIARDSGQFARAERAYRTLLMNVRRTPEAEGGKRAGGISVCEILLELARISSERGESDQSEELVESALESLAQSDVGTRLEKSLTQRGDYHLLRRVIERRLKLTENPRRKAVLYAKLADLLEGPLENLEEAFDARLEALEANPSLSTLNDPTRELASRIGKVDAYLASLEVQLEKARRSTDTYARCELLLRIGEVMEIERKDYEKAAELYTRAEEMGVREIDVWRAKARIAEAVGDTEEQTRLLSMLTQLGAQPVETRADALYRLAEIQLASQGDVEEGVASLRQALEDSPHYDRAGGIIMRATEQFPGHEGLLELFGRIARRSDNKSMFLEYLELRAAGSDIVPEEVKEAVDVALELGEGKRAEKLMERAVELGRETLEGLTRVGWALLSLARRRSDEGDMAGAVRWLCEAADSIEPEEVLAVGSEVVASAGDSNADLALAAEFYEHLLEKVRTRRDVWEPLVEIYAQLGKIDKLERLVAETIDSLAEPEERNALRLVLARALFDKKDDEGAVEILRDVLTEEPEHNQAQMLLVDHFERRGEMEEVVEILRSQLMYAQSRKDGEVIKEVALRLGGIIEEELPIEAAEIYRAALQQLPEDLDLLMALGGVLDDEEDRQEQAHVLERLIDLVDESEVSEAVLKAAEIYEELEDSTAVLRVIEKGCKLVPEDETLRSRLLASYEATGDYHSMVEMITQSAAETDDSRLKVTLLREAAKIYAETIGEPRKTLELLEQALALSPDNPSLLAELVDVHASLGNYAEAIEKISTLIEEHSNELGVRCDRLMRRAELRKATKDPAEAIGDLEQAYELDPEKVAQQLERALVDVRDLAVRNADDDAQREATFNLVTFLLSRGRREDAREALAAWTIVDRRDEEALKMLSNLDLEDSRWEGVIETCKQLVMISEGEDQIEAALRVAQGYQALGELSSSRQTLEYVRSKQPGDPRLRELLQQVYIESKDYEELANLILEEAQEDMEAPRKIELYKRAGQLMQLAENAIGAADAFSKALDLDPGDVELTLELVATRIESGDLPAADELLDRSLAAQKENRSPLIAVLQQHKARIEAARGNREAQIEWLKEAFASDRKNTDIMADLADLAEEMEDWDLAIKALRSIILLDGECRISNGQAYLRQGRIWHRRGDSRKAMQWAQRALLEEGETDEVRAFMEELEAE